MEEQVLLQVENISKTFPGTKALKNVNLTIRRGEIHALMGENGAGKSTLSNVIGGVFRPDEGGRIIFDGKEYVFHSAMDSQHAGIAFVHQETALIPALNVADNVFVGRVPKKAGIFVDTKRMRQDAQKIIDDMGAQISASTVAKELNPANAQMVEIAKALSLNCKLLILDEPTSALSLADTEKLFAIVRKLRDRGISILYISHRMSEIFDLCDTLSVMRDGELVKTVSVSEVTPDDVVKMMVGRDIGDQYPAKADHIGQEDIFRCEDVSFDPDFRDIGFSLRKNEILGFAGLVGAGRSEIIEAILGHRKRRSGRLWLNGTEIFNRSLNEAIQNGFGFVNEDRKIAGLFLDMSIKTNISAADLSNVANGQFLSSAKETEQSDRYMKDLNIKAWGINQACATLSGGNQQKVMLAKWLAIHPKVLIMDEPTKGIDVGAKKEIHELLRRLASEGVGVIVVSSDLPEIIGLCDRVLVVYEHKIVGEVSGADMNEQEIMQYASGNAAVQH